MKRTVLIKIPNFKNEDEEQEFWSNHDSSEYVNWDKAENVTLSKLKPSLQTISIRLPKILLDELKLIANKKDVPYQSLMKIFISERIEQEINK
jgi:predicted DNA binding CopG/RHH family protein